MDNQFRKKPVVIEAFQFARRNNGPVARPEWFEDAVTRNDVILQNTGKWGDTTQPAYCEIKTLEGVMRGDEGDWIIRGIKGEIYPCKPDIFEATYERAASNPASPAPVAAITDERAAFEAHYRLLYLDDSAFKRYATTDAYQHSSIACYWHGWQARAALSSAPMAQAEPIGDAQILEIARRRFKPGAEEKAESLAAFIACVKDVLAAAATPAVPAAPSEQTAAARDVLAERRRQVESEGWTPERDDEYSNCELARAAATYAVCSHIEQLKLCGDIAWPWHPDWWKRNTYRRDLTKAGALILAEIERIDRAAPAAPIERENGQ